MDIDSSRNVVDQILFFSPVRLNQVKAAVEDRPIRFFEMRFELIWGEDGRVVHNCLLCWRTAGNAEYCNPSPGKSVAKIWSDPSPHDLAISQMPICFFEAGGISKQRTFKRGVTRVA